MVHAGTGKVDTRSMVHGGTGKVDTRLVSLFDTRDLDETVDIMSEFPKKRRRNKKKRKSKRSRARYLMKREPDDSESWRVISPAESNIWCEAAPIPEPVLSIGLRRIHGEVTDSELQQLHNEISTQSLLLNNIR